MNNKGFTLIELLAMVVILGLLMAITVPNISGILKNNREIAVVEDVNRFVNNSKTKFNNKQAKYPSGVGGCVVMTLNFADTNDDLKSGVNSGKYNKYESFLLIKKERTNSDSYVYKFYVRLIEDVEKTSGVVKYEIPLTDVDLFTKNAKKYLTNLSPEVDLNLEGNKNLNEIMTKVSQMGVSCNRIDNVY